MISFFNKTKNIFNSKILLYIFIIIILLLQWILITYSLSLQYIIIISNIQIIILLYMSYKYLLKGCLISLGFNIFNGVNDYLRHIVTNNLLYTEINYFRFLSVVLSVFIAILSVRQNKFNNKLEYNSFIDGLTDVFNHRYFQERLDIEFSKAKRTATNLGIIMLDIDNFKKFNDTFGHRKGDSLLKETADVIKNNIRMQDVLARYGGDEFIIILPDMKHDEISFISEKIRKYYENFINNKEEGKSYNVSLSIGYSIYPSIASGRDELISQADSALYNAKQTGRNNIKIYKDLFNDIKQILNSTENQLIISLKTLLGTVSAKDRYTLGHSERVMEMSVKLGKYLGLSNEQLRVLKISALLHDVGKIEIPQEVLNKKTSLSDSEFKLMRMHPIYSAEIVEPLSSIGKLYSIVRHHHERFDGKGYPDGIKGEEIPLEARILSVADSFDAMRSNRPYREALSLDETVEEIKRCSGTQFDEKIAEAFINILKLEESTT